MIVAVIEELVVLLVINEGMLPVPDTNGLPILLVIVQLYVVEGSTGILVNA